MQPELIKTKICIIGAGPSGATASIFLGKMGIQHLIVDAADFPRDKICGDGIDLNAVRVLNHIDPMIVNTELADTSIFTASAGMRFILPNRKQVDIERGFKKPATGLEQLPVFYVGKRSDFDNLLVSKIDPKLADLRLQTRIIQINREGKTWKLKGKTPTGFLDIEADFLIGADGDHSIMLNYLGERKIDRKNYAGAVRQYWQGISGLHQLNLIEVYFPRRLPLSYFWIFPLPNGEANVGYGMTSHYISKNNINVRKVFEELIKTDPHLKERFINATPMEAARGWGVPMSGSQRKAHGEGWLLVGDAASIVCPSSGEGIGSGMISSYIATKFIERAIRENDLSDLMFANYEREIHKRLKNSERFFRLINFLPARCFPFLINLIFSNRFVRNGIANNAIHQWIETAYTKEIMVNLD